MKTAIYIRVSSTDQVEHGVSLEAQEAQLRAYCLLKGFEVVAVIKDAGVSGGVVLSQREGGKALLDLVKKKKVSAVVSVKLDRLFRDCVDALEVTKLWEKQGASLHLLDLGGSTLDTSSALGRFFLTVMAGAAELERSLVKDRTKAAMEHKRKKQERVSRFAPYGFQFVDGVVVPVKAEQEVVAHIKNLAAAGYKAPTIAKRLNSAGIGARGSKWYDASVRRVLVAA